MIEAYLNNEYIQAHVYFVVTCSCIVLVWQAIMIYLKSDTFKEFVRDFLIRSAIIASITIVGVIALILFG